LLRYLVSRGDFVNIALPGDSGTEVVRERLKHGAIVDTADNNGWKPLNTAAQEGHAEIIRELLKYGAKVDIKNSNGCTPFNTAA